MPAEELPTTEACETGAQERIPLTIDNIRQATLFTHFARHNCAIRIYQKDGSALEGFVHQKPMEPDQQAQNEPWYFAYDQRGNTQTQPLTYWDDETEGQALLPDFSEVEFKILKSARAVEMGTRIKINAAIPPDPQAELKKEIAEHCTEEKRQRLRLQLLDLDKITSLGDMFKFGTPFQVHIIQQVHLGEFRVIRRAGSGLELLGDMCPRTLRTATMAALLQVKIEQEKAKITGEVTDVCSLENIVKIGAQFFEFLMRLKEYLTKDYIFERFQGDFGADSEIFDQLISSESPDDNADMQSLTEITLALMSPQNIERLLAENSEQHEAIREDSQLEIFKKMLASNQQDLEEAEIEISELQKVPIETIARTLIPSPKKIPGMDTRWPGEHRKVA